MAQWTLARAASLMHLKSEETHSSLIVTGVAVDSRNVQPGQLFFALKGEKLDGHDFLAEAANKGAVGAVICASYQGRHNDLPLLYSLEPLVSLQQFARSVSQQRKAKVVAVTGSLGKTTTKEFIATLLRAQYSVGASPGNSNSQLGLPLSILNEMRGDEEIVVQEMGMTLPGQIANLVQILPPDIAVLNTIDLVHACNFDSLSDIGRAKAEIFSHPQTSLGIISRELHDYEEIAFTGNCEKQSFSTQRKDADYFLNEHENGEFCIHYKGEEHILPPLALPGKHNKHNFLAAVSVARHFEVSWHHIQQAMTMLNLPESRLQSIERNGILFINDSYNAAATSVKAALNSIPQPKGQGKKIAVLGEMLELGKFSKECHREVGEKALLHVDIMICLGEECEPIVECWNQAGRTVVWCHSLSEAATALHEQMQSNDVVLLKGSRAKGMWNLIPSDNNL